jgi:hypothetical protein
VTLREREGSAAALLRESARRLPRIEADDVEIDELTAEQLVPHCAPDEIGLLAGEQLAEDSEQIRRRR